MIYLMRHSQAVASDYKTSDDARWLTEVGRQTARESGLALAEHLKQSHSEVGNNVCCIVSSPCVRAVQTAEIVSQALEWQGEIRIVEALRSESSSQISIEELQAMPFEVILAVTHEPIVSMMSQQLAAQTNHSIRTAQSAFRTAEIRCFTNETYWSWRT